MKLKKYWTDYPFKRLGDTENQEAPVRSIKIIDYDGNLYVKIKVSGIVEWIKSGYIYTEEGRYGEVPAITLDELHNITTPTQ
jgi:hypothetical protein